MMTSKKKIIISLATLVSNVATTSAMNPECSAHPLCSNLAGDCCPTPNFEYLDCCGKTQADLDSPALCSKHSKCAAKGLDGACCPTFDGVFLYCCNDADIANKASPVPTATPAPNPPGVTPVPSSSPSRLPSASPSRAPSKKPTPKPTPRPTVAPAPGVTPPPTEATASPSKFPTPQPTPNPTPNPTPPPTFQPVPQPTNAPGPNLALVGDELWDYYELSECQGDCDYHSDCALGLVCGFRDNQSNSVFGCSLNPQAFGSGFEDFCQYPETADTAVIVADKESQLGIENYPLGLCEADCYDDNDCQGNLICVYLVEDDFLNGCSGFGEADYGYCVIPA